MSNKYLIVFSFFIYFLLNPVIYYSQFYNGSLQTFGKNRIQYESFDFSYYRYKGYEIYFYKGGDHLAKFTSIKVSEYLKQFSSDLELNNKYRIKFIIYNTLSDLRQNNFGIDNKQSQISGKKTYSGNKIYLHFNGSHKNLKSQIKKGVLRALLNQYIYEKSWTDNFVSATTSSTFPEYYIDGLIENFDLEDKNPKFSNPKILKIKKFNINTLKVEDKAVFSYYFWKYIINKYGMKSLGQIIYISGITGRLNSGLFYSIGKEIYQITNEVKTYYLNSHFRSQQKQQSLFSSIPNFKEVEATKPFKARKKVHYKNFISSYDKKYYAYFTNISGKYKIFILDAKIKRKKKIYKKGYKLSRINDLSYPIMAFHPKINLLSFVTEEKGFVIISHYDIDSKYFYQKELFKLDKVLDMQYDKSGKHIIMSGVKDGRSNIYYYTPSGNTNKPLTQDFYDDYNPTFLSENKVSFSSNRPNEKLKKQNKYKDTLRYKNQNQLYSLNIGSDNLNPVTKNRADINTNKSIGKSDKEIFFIGKKHNNPFIFYSSKDSIITGIDTIIHYKHFYNIKPIFGLDKTVKETNFNFLPNDLTLINNFDKRKREAPKTLSFPINLENKKTTITTVSKKNIKPLKKVTIKNLNTKQNSKNKKLNQFKVFYIKKEKTLENNEDINIYNFKFLSEEKKVKKLYSKTKENTTVSKKPLFKFPNKRNYILSFFKYNSKVKVAGSYLNNQYQVFNGGPFTSPGLSFYTKLSISELFENYKAYFGFQLGNRKEFFVKIENNKNRVDKEYFYSFSRLANGSNNTKITTQRLSGKYIYPFNEVTAIEFQPGIRYDKITPKAISSSINDPENSLRKSESHNFEGIFKTSLIFDNSKLLETNIYSGMRFKIFGEYYQDIIRQESKEYMINIGFDFRHYLKIYKTIILANRFAGATSLGTKRLIYYLGSVDGQIFNSNLFNKDIPVKNDFNYRYQTLAPNIRGFAQNIRNGHNFALANTELRIPVSQFFTRKLIENNFFRSLQLIGFFDIGMAWSKFNPYDDYNVITETVKTEEDFKVTIIDKKHPMVAGLGYGVRFELFSYFIRLDFGHGIQNNIINKKPKIYISLEYDF